MKYADFLGFPFPQHELMKKEGELAISKDVVLDACHVTTAPPFVTRMPDIVREHNWFVQLLRRQENASDIAFFYGLQHPPTDANVSDLRFLREDLGIRFVTLAYELESEYGGGFASPQAPLTEKGKNLIKAMAETGMILDLSHAGHRTAREALRFIKEESMGVSVVATHTACFDLFDHPRGLPDDVLQGIADLGGMIGLVTILWMLDEAHNSIESFIRHLSYLVDLVGQENVCLGTDGVYQHLDVETAEALFSAMKGKIDPRGNFRARYPEQAPELNCPDRLRVIESHLRRLGWSDDGVKNIIGENLIRYLRGI